MLDLFCFLLRDVNLITWDWLIDCEIAMHGIAAWDYQVKIINDIAFHMVVLRLSLIAVPKWYSGFFMRNYSALALNF